MSMRKNGTSVLRQTATKAQEPTTKSVKTPIVEKYNDAETQFLSVIEENLDAKFNNVAEFVVSAKFKELGFTQEEYNACRGKLVHSKYNPDNYEIMAFWTKKRVGKGGFFQFKPVRFSKENIAKAEAEAKKAPATAPATAPAPVMTREIALEILKALGVKL